MTSSNQLTENYLSLLQQIENYQRIYNNTNKIQLVAVSKTRSVEDIIHLNHLGQKDFGENYLQEAINKINIINQNNLGTITWHYIGRIQTNKIRAIVQHFDWVHSVDSIKTAEKLNNNCLSLNKQLNILLQVNIDQDDHKSGALDTDTLNTIKHIHDNYDQLKIHGLMCMLKQDNNNFQTQLLSFKKLDNLLEDINQQLNLDLNILSMGMSLDFPAAIAASQHNLMLRIGTSLFGERV